MNKWKTKKELSLVRPSTLLVPSDISDSEEEDQEQGREAGEVDAGEQEEDKEHGREPGEVDEEEEEEDEAQCREASEVDEEEEEEEWEDETPSHKVSP